MIPYYRSDPVVCTVVWTVDLIIFCTVFCKLGYFLTQFLQKTAVSAAKSRSFFVQVFAQLVKKCTTFCNRRLQNPGRGNKCSGLKYKGNLVLPCFGAKPACYQNRYYDNRNYLIYKEKHLFLFNTAALQKPAFSIIYISITKLVSNSVNLKVKKGKLLDKRTVVAKSWLLFNQAVKNHKLPVFYRIQTPRSLTRQTCKLGGVKKTPAAEAKNPALVSPARADLRNAAARRSTSVYKRVQNRPATFGLLHAKNVTGTLTGASTTMFHTNFRRLLHNGT